MPSRPAGRERQAAAQEGRGAAKASPETRGGGAAHARQDNREEGATSHLGRAAKAGHPDVDWVSFLCRFLLVAWLHSAHVMLAMCRTPLDLVLAAMAAASEGDIVFWRTRSSTINRVEDSPEEDFGLDPEDAELCAWQDRNKALEEEAATIIAAEEASAQAWAKATERGEGHHQPGLAGDGGGHDAG